MKQAMMGGYQTVKAFFEQDPFGMRIVQHFKECGDILRESKLQAF